MEKSQFVCQQCGWSSPKWQGQCGGCQTWNSLVEEVLASKKLAGHSKIKLQPVYLTQVNKLNGFKKRLSTGIGELDRVLGGEETLGLVAGAVVLLGGSPGVGKSTLLTQVVINLLKNKDQTSKQKKKVLYVAGEESPEQIYLRINRILKNEHNKLLKSKTSLTQDNWQENLGFLVSHDVDQIISSIEELKPSLVVVDSVQTLVTSELSGAPGSIGQVRECADRLTHLAKKTQTPIFLVGHITKEGKLAGPMVLEHIVDVILEMSGESDGQLRLLRAKKNRFGSTDEVGVLQMMEDGLWEVSDPAKFFLSSGRQNRVGSVISCVLEGSRPLLVEVQALVVYSKLAFPRRVARGVSNTKLQLICAILEKHCHLPISQCDVYLNLAGGLSSVDPGLDLPAAIAVASSFNNKTFVTPLCLVGEVGLLGEVRPASSIKKRVTEAKKLGFQVLKESTQSQTDLLTILRTLNLSK